MAKSPQVMEGDKSDSSSPAWFQQALAVVPETHECMSAGILVRYKSWNAADTLKPPILLVHGFRAHTHWWDFIAPQFLPAHRVFALDLAGMGDSDWRSQYTSELYCEDILSVIAAANLDPVTLVGHSFGGLQVLRTCANHAGSVARAIIVDSRISFHGEAPPQPRPFNRVGPYPDRASILARFQLRPEQPTKRYLKTYVANQSIRRTPKGWYWKFDPHLAYTPSSEDGPTLLRRLRIPVAYIRGELSAVVSPERAAKIGRVLPKSYGVGPITIPGSHHHIMLDQPHQLVESIGVLLRLWH